MKLENNIVVDTDAYKATHHLQYPTGLSKMYSYCESRIGSKFDNGHVYKPVNFNDVIKQANESNRIIKKEEVNNHGR